MASNESHLFTRKQQPKKNIPEIIMIAKGNYVHVIGCRFVHISNMIKLHLFIVNCNK